MALTQNCNNCAYFTPLTRQCHAHAPLPTLMPGPGGQIAALWPEISKANWCGEWKKEDATHGGL